MQLEINLSPNITTRPKGNTGEKKVNTSSKTGKGGHITHFKVVPEELKNILRVFYQKKSLVPISSFSKTG